MASTKSRPKHIPVPISIPPKSSKDDPSSSDEDSTNFVGTPYRFDRSNPYEYPFPPPTSTIPTSTSSNAARLPSSPAVSPPSNAIPTLFFLSSKSSSARPCRSCRSNIPTPPSKSPPVRAPPPPPPTQLRSRLPSSITMSLKLDLPAPVPPNLIGRSLGSLSPALGLEPGELLTLKKANVLGRRERLDRPGPGRPTQAGR